MRFFMKKNRILQFVSLFIFIISPYVLHAQSANLSYFEGFLTEFGGLLTTLIPILVAVALAVFIWGLVIFIAKSGDDKAKEEGKEGFIDISVIAGNNYTISDSFII